MATFKKSELDFYHNWTHPVLRGKDTTELPPITWLGTYRPKGKSWHYDVGAFVWQNDVEIAVFRFGHII